MSEMDDKGTDNRDGTVPNDGKDATPATETVTEGSDTHTNDAQPDEVEKLRAQLKAINDESAGRRLKIKELEDAIKAKERAELDEADRLKAELADLKGADEERTALSERIEKYESVIQSQVDALKKELKVPDYIAALLDDKSPADQLNYLVANRTKLQPESKKKPDIDADAKGSSKTKLTDTEKEARETNLRQRMRLRRR